MPGPVYGQHFSVRVPEGQARDFDALAHAAGLHRSELLRLLIVRAADGGMSPALLAAGVDLRVARTIADLAGSEAVDSDHLDEAARFRSPSSRLDAREAS